MTARSLAAATVVLRSVLMGEEQGRADNAVMDDATAAKERGRKGSVFFILPQLTLVLNYERLFPAALGLDRRFTRA